MAKKSGNTVVEASKAVAAIPPAAQAVLASTPATPANQITSGDHSVAIPANGIMTTEMMLARIAELEKIVVNKKAIGTRIKVSEKGGVSFYGIGRWPVTLYKSQWEVLAENLPAIMAFVAENASMLSVKETEKQAQATV